jgi:DNA polymerase V
MVTDIVSRNAVQQSLFATAGEREKRRRLMDVIDRINNSDTATDKLHLATTTPNHQRVKQEELSPLYSTRLSDIITVKTS